MKFLFKILRTEFLYSNNLVRLIPEYVAYIATNGARPSAFTLQELKRILNVIYGKNKKLSTQDPVLMIRPCPCRDAQHKYSEKLPNITDVVFTTNRKDYKIGPNNKFMTKEELFKKLDYFDEVGLVHIVLGCMGEMGGGVNICNCHKSVCFVLQAILGRDFKKGLRKGPSMASVDSTKCKGIKDCGICLTRCQFHVRGEMDGKGTILEQCYGCGLCANTCPDKATTMVPRSDWTPTYFPESWLR